MPELLVPTVELLKPYKIPRDDGLVDVLDWANHIFGSKKRQSLAPASTHFAEGPILLDAYGYSETSRNYPKLYGAFDELGFRDDEQIYHTLCKAYFGHDVFELYDKKHTRELARWVVKNSPLSLPEQSAVLEVSNMGEDYDTEFIPRIIASGNPYAIPIKKADIASNARVSPMSIPVLLDNPSKELRTVLSWPRAEMHIEDVQPTPLNRFKAVHEAIGYLTVVRTEIALALARS